MRLIIKKYIKLRNPIIAVSFRALSPKIMNKLYLNWQKIEIKTEYIKIQTSLMT